MKKIAIIGGGFAGTLTAVQIIEKSTTVCDIILINDSETLNRGIAYHPYSNKHLLNVTAEKMSAFPDQPNHFLDWVMQQPDFADKDSTLVANSFLPRDLYGTYLTEIWQYALQSATVKKINVAVIDGTVTDISITENTVMLSVANNPPFSVNYCVLATGNNLPRNPPIGNNAFYTSKNYFQNPWHISSVKGITQTLPVLIIGNGLTMVDTVLGLMEQHFKGEIYAISPNGFNILSHRHNGLKYTKLTTELSDNISLFDLVKLINKHIKAVREYGISAEPIIDSLRPHTQRIWQSLTEAEQKIFMARLRHLWGVARHRIPLHTFDKIMQLRIDGKLHIIAGKILDINESQTNITVDYFDKKENITQQLNVSRVINCTGPETDIMNLHDSFLKACLLKGIIRQDTLKLGILANTETFQVKDSNGRLHPHLYTIGGNLRGELWESTAVNELRQQAAKLATQLTQQL
ncbi:MAG: FAD/NAD(P)-binding protein [Saprospiraceae bacterium]|nr:FAD/NAD(P)-binding protein [Saprospiraceae bacterium]MBP7680006.1 FAD/NAD(P)-binding protein [Saprospiraceae bacterium]